MRDSALHLGRDFPVQCVGTVGDYMKKVGTGVLRSAVGSIGFGVCVGLVPLGTLADLKIGHYTNRWASTVFAQDSAKAAADTPKTAEQLFKNIQALKGVPAEQVIPTMQFISASLGVECEFCHVEHQMEKDDKKEKQTARKMIAMELAINKGNFDEKVEVTCYTCHRGSAHPVGTPILSAEAKPLVRGHEEMNEGHANLPSAEQLLDKYLAAVGGADALKKIKTREEKGTMEAMGKQFPIQVYCEAPDKRVSIWQIQAGPNVTAFNGEVGWLTIPPNGMHWMTGPEREAARIDAEMYFPARVREMYKEFHVMPGEPADGHETMAVAAKAPGRPGLRMFFDQESGLLIRLIKYTETPLGRLPTQIDYGDYKQTDGVKIPYRWTLVRPNGSFTIRVEQVQQNVAIDQKWFEAPAAGSPKS
jgi:photosynthetic reaction center cytochrome c subunit